LLGNGSVNIPEEANARNRGAVSSAYSATLVAMQRWDKRVSAVVNQHATIEDAVFSVWALGSIEKKINLWFDAKMN
jgi:hypothetical protein